MENFSFLKNDYPDLYLLCFDVAKYIDSDKSISMLKARQAIEFIVKYLGAETDDLFVNINNLEDKNIANSRIIELFHFIRKKANKSVHNEINSDTEGVLDALIEICVWLAVGRDKKNISIIKFSDKEKYFLKKYGKFDAETIEEELDKVDTINPLEVVGKFSDEDIETTDVLEQDVFETYEEYCERIESMPPMKIGYVFLDESQIDKYAGISFPLFHINKNPKIESSPIAALYVLKKDVSNLDGILKAKLCIYNNKIYYNYDSLSMEDDYGNAIKLDVLSWNKYGYEDEETFIQRIGKLPLLPVGIARPIRKEYSLSNQILPFEVKPMAYVSKLFNKNTIDCHLSRDTAKEICSLKSNFIVYSNFDDNLEPLNIRFCNIYSDWMVVFDTKGVVSKIKRKEFEFLEVLKAADRGVIDAQYKLARLYECGYGVEENLPKALDWLRKAAEQGCVQAQFDMAFYYENGYGVEENEQKAFEWYKKAAEQGYGRAQSNLAECYRLGYGVEEDVKEADYWLEKKAIKDDYNIEWYKKVAAQGYRNAQYHLALWYMNEDSPENENEVVELFRKAADQGLTDAQLRLADCYEFGYGIKANEQKAFEWYKKAAEQGDCNAQLNLGRFYARGLGTEKNAQKAFEWFKKAAEQGYARAQYDLAIRYENGDGVEADEQKALEWYKKAAEQGDALSQNNLGRFYELKCNDKEAIKWYRKAAKHGYGNAEIALNRFGADKNYSIVVIGEFSTGKSAFINALAGKVILPSSKKPSTVVVTEVTYSESPAYVIHYRNGNVINVSEEEFMSIKAQYSFDLKPNDYDKIKYVEVGYPATFFKNGLKVIDTPGTDNISRTCLKVNEPYLRIADAVVLMMSVFSPLTTREKEFLVDYSRNYGTDNLFLVVSHKDEFENSDEENCVRQNILNRLSDLGDFSNRLFMVSIKQALLYRRKELGEMLRPKMLQELPDTIEETGLTIFEKELISYIDTYR